MTEYNFTVELRPYGDSPDAGVVKVDPDSRYGYWEHRDGTEGGGLWFEQTDSGLELVDYDGDYFLPRRVIAALTSAGFFLDENFE